VREALGELRPVVLRLLKGWTISTLARSEGDWCGQTNAAERTIKLAETWQSGELNVNVNQVLRHEVCHAIEALVIERIPRWWKVWTRAWRIDTGERELALRSFGFDYLLKSEAEAFGELGSYQIRHPSDPDDRRYDFLSQLLPRLTVMLRTLFGQLEMTFKQTLASRQRALMAGATGSSPDDFLFEAIEPRQAVEFFERKGYRLSWSWRDTWQAEHARAFTVAKMMALGLLTDVREQVQRAIKEGIAFEDFRDALEPLMKSAGWWGRQPMTDPLTGETREVQLGSYPRLELIYDTNLRTSYAAGQWQDIQEAKEELPFLRYIDPDPNPRPDHLDWSNAPTILPVDDAWWSTHYPPNGFNCKCYVDQMAPTDLEDRGYTPSESAPPGAADEGWNYNVGMAGVEYSTELAWHKTMTSADSDIVHALNRLEPPKRRRP